MGRKRKDQDLNPTSDTINTTPNKGHIVDFANRNSYTNLINKHDSPRYGSATKEIEAITAEKNRVANFFAKLHGNSVNSGNSPILFPISSLNPSPSGLGPVSNSNTGTNPFSKSSHMNLDSDEDELNEVLENILPVKIEKEPEIREEKDKGMIVILSDDENEDENEIINDSSSEAQNQIVQYDQSSSNLFAQLSPMTTLQTTPLSYFQPSIQFSSVVLTQYSAEEHKRDLEVAKNLEERATPQIKLDLSKSISKMYEREKGRKVRSDTGRNRKLNLSTPITKMESPVVGSPEMEPEPEPEPSGTSSPLDTLHEDEMEEPETDDFDHLWKDMALAMQCYKAEVAEEKKDEEKEEEEEEEDDDEDVCEHKSKRHDEFGDVCEVCGVILEKIENIIEVQFKKRTRTGRSFYDPFRSNKKEKEVDFGSVKVPQDYLKVVEIALHPRHSRLIKSHQLAGFKFLVKNLISESPGGCILAHAPGSGKTFMLIAFIQSFLAKYPDARPLVVLPKGILSTWKKEFKRWQVEDIVLLDFYSVKAEKRTEQLAILNEWQEKRSILFLGYTQFSTIVCGGNQSKVGSACQDRLLKVPSLLIIDEGHTARTQDTNVLDSLSKVQTKRKVVLSGTLFQNHVQEVFNILNLVRPKFLKSETARSIVKRVLSRVSISGSRRVPKGVPEAAFFDLVEETIRSDESFNRKVRVIQDLRELTKDVLHYYKGDFLDELPGLVDLTIMLKLSPKQEEFKRKIENYEKFKRTSVGTAVYMHPKLAEISEIAHADRAASCIDSKMDLLVQDINIKEGVKMKFFLSVLNLAESAGEKVLVFSQYIVPLKFLERYLVQTKGWRMGKEIFLISGDSGYDEREWSMEQFNNSSEAKVLFGSIKACGEGISLVGASRVVVLDVHFNPSVTRQAIGRAFRPGQTKKVFIYRLVAFGSPEEKVHQTSFRKELVSKMWFEWSEFCHNDEFELDEVAIEDCGDFFLESSFIKEDIKAMYKR